MKGIEERVWGRTEGWEKRKRGEVKERRKNRGKGRARETERDRDRETEREWREGKRERGGDGGEGKYIQRERWEKVEWKKKLCLCTYTISLYWGSIAYLRANASTIAWVSDWKTGGILPSLFSCRNMFFLNVINLN